MTGYETTDWAEPYFVGQHGYISHDKEEVNTAIDFGQYKFYVGNHQEKTPLHLNYKEAETLWFTVNGKIEACESGYVKKMLGYGYLKKTEEGIVPNVVVFDHNAEKPYNAELTAKLTALKNEICELFRQAPSVGRGYVVEQAIADG